jgi:dipeptidyl aminopeptidase/acylaminoacyl peptidase
VVTALLRKRLQKSISPELDNRVFAGVRTLMKASVFAFLLGPLASVNVASAAPARHLVQLDDLDGVQAGQVAILATLDLSPDGHRLAVERGGELSVVDVGTGQTLQMLGEGLIPRWSPDSRQLAFYSRRSGELQLWLWGGGEPRQLTQLSDGIDPDVETRIMGYVGDAFRYSWSPRGDQIAFPSRVPMPAANAEAGSAPLVLTTTTPPDRTLQDVFAHPGGGTGGVIAAPNGRDIAFRASRRGDLLFNQIFIIDVRTGVTTQLSHDRATSFDPAWSPDGQTIAYARVDASDANSAADIIAAKDGEIVLFELTTRHARVVDQGPGIKFQPQWEPRGRRLAYLASQSFESGAVIRLIEPQGGRAGSIALAGPVVQYGWDRAVSDGFLVSYEGEGSGETQAPSHWRVRDVAELGQPVSGPVGPWSQDRHGAIAWVQDEAGPNLWLSSPRTKDSRKLLSLSSTSDLQLATSEIVKWRNVRGEELQGQLLYPANYVKGRKYPLIVDVYPFPPTDGWMNPMSGNQAWASAGYMIFKAQPRAPHSAPNCSAPTAFCAAGRGPAALDVMIDDVMSGIDTLDRRGLIDRNRMCLFGHSNGGGVVDYLVTRTAAFKCAVSVAPVLPNWLGTSFLWYDGLGLISRLAGAEPWQNPNAYVQLSAVLQVDKVRTPMLLADGDEDGAFLLGSIEMYNALRAAGANVTFVRYPGQGHSLTGPALRDFWQRETAFFAEYLKPGKAD